MEDPLKLPPYEHRLRVRYAETDQMGVVHHANYLLYFEEARTRLMDELGCSYAALERQGIGMPVRRTELRYWSGAVYDEELVVLTTVGRMRAASVTFHYEILRDPTRERVATGSIELACVQLNAERRPTALPDSFIEAVNAKAPRMELD